MASRYPTEIQSPRGGYLFYVGAIVGHLVRVKTVPPRVSWLARDGLAVESMPKLKNVRMDGVVPSRPSGIMAG